MFCIIPATALQKFSADNYYMAFTLISLGLKKEEVACFPLPCDHVTAPIRAPSIALVLLFKHSTPGTSPTIRQFESEVYQKNCSVTHRKNTTG